MTDMLHSSPRSTHRRAVRALALVAIALLSSAAGSAAGSNGPVPVSGDPIMRVPDTLRGRSGRLLFRILRADADRSLEVAPLARLFGPDALSRPGLLAVRDSITDESFHFAALVPFAQKQNGRVGVYSVGRWPGEVRRPRGDAYRVPEGFIEVTDSMRPVRVSTHFTIGQFLTKDQRDVWPKMLLLDERLVDKLELVVSELRLAGIKAPGLEVLSGFRTPQYNARGKNAGRATDSRHQYGDAADVYVDANGDGRMDDITGDGKVDIRDAVRLARIVERVERKYPDIQGGLGVYRATGAHGPFVHIDARGQSARWGFPQ
jgi:hypothetical protein